MPDLTLEAAWVCETVRDFTVQVRGSSGLHTVTLGRASSKSDCEYDWSCDCKAGHFGRPCKHIGVAKRADRCRWNEELDPTAEPVHLPNGSVICPRCGGPVFSIRVAV